MDADSRCRWTTEVVEEDLEVCEGDIGTAHELDERPASVICEFVLARDQGVARQDGRYGAFHGVNARPVLSVCGARPPGTPRRLHAAFDYPATCARRAAASRPCTRERVAPARACSGRRLASRRRGVNQNAAMSFRRSRSRTTSRPAVTETTCGGQLKYLLALYGDSWLLPMMRAFVDAAMPEGP